jgi:hypothetical protein
MNSVFIPKGLPSQSRWRVLPSYQVFAGGANARRRGVTFFARRCELLHNVAAALCGTVSP